MSQFPEDGTDGTEFLKNWSNSKDGRGRKQNLGLNKLNGFSKVAAKLLGKEGNFTTHSFRRSGATALAESGISVVGLCNSGRWKSLVTAQEYHDDTEAQKRDRVERLDNGHELTVSKRHKQ